MANDTDNKAASLEAQAAKMKAILQALGAGDVRVVRANETLQTLGTIDKFTGKGDSRTVGPDGHISGEEMAAYIVEKFKATHGGSDKQIRDDIAAMERYQQLNEEWKKQGPNGRVTPTMVGKASEADEQAWGRISALMQDEPEKLKHNLRLMRADYNKLQAEQTTAPTVAAERKAEAPLKPEQFASAAAGLANARDGQEYKDNATRLMRGMEASDPRVKGEQDKQAGIITGRFDAIGDKLAGKLDAAAAKAAAKQDEMMQIQAGRLRAMGQGEVADRMLKQYADRKAEQQHREIQGERPPQMVEQMREIARADVAAQKKESMDGAYAAMGRVAPAKEAADPNAALKAALGDTMVKALKYEGHVEPVSLGDLKNAVAPGAAATKTTQRQ